MNNGEQFVVKSDKNLKVKEIIYLMIYNRSEKINIQGI